MDFSTTNNDENHRLLEEIMNTNILTHEQNNNGETDISKENTDRNSHLASFLSDPSFLNISSYPQLRAEKTTNANDDSTTTKNRNGDKDANVSNSHIEDAHEFLKFDINTLHNTLSNSDKFNADNNGNNNNQHIYPSTPAQQHEKLLYEKRIGNNIPIRHTTSTTTTPPATVNNENDEPVASFLDDMFTTTHLNKNNINNTTTSSHITNSHALGNNPQIHHGNLHSSTSFRRNSMEKSQHGSISNIDTSFLHDTIPSRDPFHKSSFSTSITRDSHLSTSFQPHSFNGETMNPDFLFNTQNDDAMLNYTDDISSSFGSSVTSDIMTPSSYSFNPQQFELLTRSDSNSNLLSSSIRSPSTISPLYASNNNATTPSTTSNNNNTNNTSGSLRATNYLSQSLRQPNMMGTTPKSRHSSLANNLNNIDSLSTSVPKSLSHLSTEEKLRRKRDFHNAVERRRRELIKQKIKELGNLVPPSLLCYDSTGKQVKPNKGIILNKTVDYINFLLRVLELQEYKKTKLLSKIDELETQFGKLDTSDTLTPMNTDLNNNIVNDTSVKVETNNEIEMDVEVKPQISDDLKQFLSGELAEAEDNAKLMFSNNEDKNPADYLLEFDS